MHDDPSIKSGEEQYRKPAGTMSAGCDLSLCLNKGRGHGQSCLGTTGSNIQSDPTHVEPVERSKDWDLSLRSQQASNRPQTQVDRCCLTERLF